MLWNINKLVESCNLVAPLFKCHICKGILDNKSKDNRFKENTCFECGDREKERERK